MPSIFGTLQVPLTRVFAEAQRDLLQVYATLTDYDRSRRTT